MRTAGIICTPSESYTRQKEIVIGNLGFCVVAGGSAVSLGKLNRTAAELVPTMRHEVLPFNGG